MPGASSASFRAGRGLRHLLRPRLTPRADSAPRAELRGEPDGSAELQPCRRSGCLRVEPGFSAVCGPRVDARSSGRSCSGCRPARHVELGRRPLCRPACHRLLTGARADPLLAPTSNRRRRASPRRRRSARRPRPRARGLREAGPGLAVSLHGLSTRANGAQDGIAGAGLQRGGSAQTDGPQPLRRGRRIGVAGDAARGGDERRGRPGAKAAPRSSGRPPCAPTPGIRKIARASARAGGRSARERSRRPPRPSRSGPRPVEPRRQRRPIAARRSCSGASAAGWSWSSAAPGFVVRTRAKTPAPVSAAASTSGSSASRAEQRVGGEGVGAEPATGPQGSRSRRAAPARRRPR